MTSLAAQMVKSLSALQETWVRSLGWKDPLEEAMANYSSILAWRILWTDVSDGLSPWGRKESDTTERERTAHSLSYVEPVPPSLLPGM